MENSFLIVERHNKKNTRGEKKAFDKINMDTVVSSMGPGEIAVVAIGCGLGALLVGSVGAPFSSNFLSFSLKEPKDSPLIALSKS